MSEPFEGVYLVGGAVRDVLMGEPNFDVDIAVEGDGIALGRGARAGARRPRVPHERFGTAIVSTEGGRVDVATAEDGVLRQPGRAADGRAGVDPPGSLPPRFHDQRDGRLAPAARTSVVSSTTSAGTATSRRGRPRPAQPVLHRRPDADLPRRSATRRATASAMDAHTRARQGVRGDEPRRRAFVGTPARRAAGPALRGARGRIPSAAWPSSASTARSIPIWLPMKRLCD